MSTPLEGLDPAQFGAALSVLPINHPLVVAASLAVETAHARHDREVALRDASHDVSAAADWSRVAADHVTFDELQARRARLSYPADRAPGKESAMSTQPRQQEPHAEAAVEQAHRAVTEASTAQAHAADEEPHQQQPAGQDIVSSAVVDDGPAAGAW